MLESGGGWRVDECEWIKFESKDELVEDARIGTTTMTPRGEVTRSGAQAGV